MYGVWLIAIIAVMGGAIAYIGDKLGTRVGKKKLMIFGLRPKHTSIIVTIVTGILIAATTLGLLASSSQDVRTALFGMEALKSQLLQLSKEVSVQNIELETSRTNLEAKNAEYSALSAKIAETSAKLNAITEELAQVTAERDKTAAALSDVHRDYDAKLIELYGTKGDLTKARRDINSLQVTKSELDTKVGKLNIAKDTLQKDFGTLTNYVNELNFGMHKGTIIAQDNEILNIARITGSNKETIEKELNQFMFNTNQLKAKQLGLDNKVVLQVSKEMIGQAVGLLTKNEEKYVVGIFAARNAFYGEMIIGKFTIIPNRLVFKKGSIVLSDTVDFGIGKTALELQGIIKEFCAQKLNKVAEKQGVIRNPTSGVMGGIPMQELFQVINTMQKMHGRVEISAVAKQDIDVAGPFEIEIRARSLD